MFNCFYILNQVKCLSELPVPHTSCPVTVHPCEESTLIFTTAFRYWESGVIFPYAFLLEANQAHFLQPFLTYQLHQLSHHLGNLDNIQF